MGNQLKETPGALSAARIISQITNPCFLSIVMLLAITFSKSNRFYKLAEWGIIVFLFLMLLPVLYVIRRTRFNWKNIKLIYYPMLFLKEHPTDILILGVVCGLPCWVILNCLNAPSQILNTLFALLITAMVIALVNLRYRASFHLAGVTVLIYISVATWGLLILCLVLIVPPTIWAKYRLHDHDIAQMLLGIALGLVITSLTLYWLG